MKGNNKNTITVLPKKAVMEFMEIYSKTCKQKIKFEKAQTEALNLLRLFYLLSR